MKEFKIIAILLAAYIHVVYTEDDCTPKQIHLSLGERFYSGPRNTTGSEGVNEIANIVWVTEAECSNNTVVEILPSKSKKSFTYKPITEIYSANLSDWRYNNNVTSNYTRYTHIVRLFDEIVPNLIHYVKINQTDTFNFTIPSVDQTEFPLTFLFYADIDINYSNYTSNHTIQRISSMLADSECDINLTLVGGDIAYNLEYDGGMIGDKFMENLQPLVTTRPMMISPGNHDRFNGSYGLLNYRYQMPNYRETQNQYYSYDVGPVHFVSINLDWFEYTNDTITRNTTLAQNRNLTLEWIKNDLMLANTPDNRTERPWIIMYSHRPIYCSFNFETDTEDRKCYSFYENRKDLDELLKNYTVDLFLAGHVHSYERMGPIYQNKSVNYESITDRKSGIQTIINPNATIHIVDGAAGNSNYMPNASYPPSNYSIKTDIDVGFTRIEVHGKTVLKMQHIKSINGDIIDEFFLRKDRHLDPTYPRFGIYFLVAASILIIVFIALAVTWYYKHRKQSEAKSTSDELEAPITQINQEKMELSPYHRGL